jgi:hypothetical protein
MVEGGDGSHKVLLARIQGSDGGNKERFFHPHSFLDYRRRRSDRDFMAVHKMKYQMDES